MKNKLFFFGAYQGDRFLTSSPGPVQVESPQFRSAAIAAFPDSVAALLYKSFPPSTQGTPLMTLRDYVTSREAVLGVGLFQFRGVSMPGKPRSRRLQSHRGCGPVEPLCAIIRGGAGRH